MFFLKSFFPLGDLKPVGAKAQKKVPVPNGLNLDEWIIDQSDDEEVDDEIDFESEEKENDIDQAVYEYKNSQKECKLNFLNSKNRK